MNERFLDRAVFLDRDGVINEVFLRDGKPRAPLRLEDFRFFPGVEEAAARLRAAGFRLVVVTNQPDAVTREERSIVEAMHEAVRARLGVDAIKVCFHGRAEGCSCRKPKPGMLLEAAAELGIDLSRSFMVGDRMSDIRAGEAAGCAGTFLVLNGFDPRFAEDLPNDPRAVEAGSPREPDQRLGSLLEVAQVLTRN